MAEPSPSPIEVLSWWSTVAGTVAALVLGTISTWLTWRMYRDSTTRAAAPEPTARPSTDEPVAAAVAATATTGTGETVRPMARADERPSAARLRQRLKVLLAVSAGTVGTAAVGVATGLLAIVVVPDGAPASIAAADTPVRVVEEGCSSGACLNTYHWAVAQGGHVTVRYDGPTRSTPREGKVRLFIQAGGCDGAGVVAWTARVDDVTVARGEARSEKRSSEFPIRSGQAFEVAAERSDGGTCPVDLMMYPMVLFD